MRASAYPQTASDVLREAHDAVDGETSTVGELIDALGVASYTPLVMLPSLALVSPLSGIPGFTALCGVLIAAVCAQQIMERPSLWLPGWIKRAEMSSDKARRALSWLVRPVGWLDRVTRRRLHGLVTPPLVRFPQGVCLVLGLIMPLLELIPFTSSIAAAVIALVTTGIFMGDGLLVLMGLICAGAIAGGFAVLV